MVCVLGERKPLTSRMHLLGFSQLSISFGLDAFFLLAMWEWQDMSVISLQTFCKSLLATKYMAIHIKTPRKLEVFLMEALKDQ